MGKRFELDRSQTRTDFRSGVEISVSKSGSMVIITSEAGWQAWQDTGERRRRGTSTEGFDVLCRREEAIGAMGKGRS